MPATRAEPRGEPIGPVRAASKAPSLGLGDSDNESAAEGSVLKEIFQTKEKSGVPSAPKLSLFTNDGKSSFSREKQAVMAKWSDKCFVLLKADSLESVESMTEQEHAGRIKLQLSEFKIAAMAVTEGFWSAYNEKGDLLPEITRSKMPHKMKDGEKIMFAQIIT